MTISLRTFNRDPEEIAAFVSNSQESVTGDFWRGARRGRVQRLNLEVVCTKQIPQLSRFPPKPAGWKVRQDYGRSRQPSLGRG